MAIGSAQPGFALNPANGPAPMHVDAQNVCGHGYAAIVDVNAGCSRPKFVVGCNDEVREQPLPGEHGKLGGGGEPPGQGSGSSNPPECRAGQKQANLLADAGDFSWRQEVSERLHRYHARRRPRAPRYPSLRLKFDTPETSWGTPSRDVPVSPQAAQLSAAQPTTRQAVAREYVEAVAPPPTARAEPAISEAPAETPRRRFQETVAKVIEFPRTMYAPPVHLHDLAESILDRPRILEAPEIVPPPPALGGLTIEETERPEPERRAGIDMPLQTASLEERLLAVVVDAGIVVAAAGVFGGIFYKLTNARLSFPQMTALVAGLVSALWAAYQYLLIVYSGTTPGLRALKLRVQRFDGKPVSRRVRRWRVLGSMLSGISLGMGYAWHFLDEDGLCWHERVTKTHIAPLKP